LLLRSRKNTEQRNPNLIADSATPTEIPRRGKKWNLRINLKPQKEKSEKGSRIVSRGNVQSISCLPKEAKTPPGLNAKVVDASRTEAATDCFSSPILPKEERIEETEDLRQTPRQISTLFCNVVTLDGREKVRTLQPKTPEELVNTMGDRFFEASSSNTSLRVADDENANTNTLDSTLTSDDVEYEFEVKLEAIPGKIVNSMGARFLEESNATREFGEENVIGPEDRLKKADNGTLGFSDRSLYSIGTDDAFKIKIEVTDIQVQVLEKIGIIPKCLLRLDCQS